MAVGVDNVLQGDSAHTVLRSLLYFVIIVPQSQLDIYAHAAVGIGMGILMQDGLIPLNGPVYVQQGDVFRLFDQSGAGMAFHTDEQTGRIPSELLPRCPRCGGSMAVHIAAGPGFIEDTGARQRYREFLERYRGKKLLVLELGVGWRNQLIKAPFMRLVAQEPLAAYVTINLGEVYIADDIKARSFGIDGALSDVLATLRKECIK